MGKRKEKVVATFSYSDICEVSVSTEKVIVFGRFGDNVSPAQHTDDRIIPPIKEIPKNTDFIYFADRNYIQLNGYQVDAIDRNASKHIFIGWKSTDDIKIGRMYPNIDISTVDFFLETVNGGLFPIHKGSIEGKDFILRE